VVIELFLGGLRRAIFLGPPFFGLMAVGSIDGAAAQAISLRGFYIYLTHCYNTTARIAGIPKQ
jgi:hypothetical protein